MTEHTANMQIRSQRWVIWAFPVLLIVAVAVQYSMRWEFAVPCGDEAGNIESAMRMAESGRLTFDLYKLFYIFLFRVGIADPIRAHFIMRAFASISSTLLLYAYLNRPASGYSRLAAVLCSLWWCRSFLNTAVCQFGNVNLFLLALVLPALILLSKRRTLARVLFLLSLLLVASFTRVEYLAPLVLTTLVYGLLWWRDGCPRPKTTWALIFALVMLLVASGIRITSQPEKGHSINTYLLLGLNQCYTFLYVQNHPDMGINPMQEYEAITDKVFGHAETFTDAFLYNPYAVLSYLTINGLNNSIMFVPSILAHRTIVPPFSSQRARSMELAVFISLVVVGVFLALRRNRERLCDGLSDVKAVSQKNMRLFHGVVHLSLRMLEHLDHVGVLPAVLLCTASSVSLVLLIPDARYWITCIPMLYLVLTYGLSHFLCALPRLAVTISTTVTIVMMLSPYPCPTMGNVRAIRHIRENWDLYPTPTVAGQAIFGFYAFGLRYRPMSFEQLLPEVILNRRCDMLVVTDDFRTSEIWQIHTDFWSRFEHSPESFSYMRTVNISSGDALAVYIRHPKAQPIP